MPDTHMTRLEASAPAPVTDPAAMAALRKLRIAAEHVAHTIALEAERLREAEHDLAVAMRDQAPHAPAHGGAGHLSELFAMTRQAILRSLPHSAARSEALLLLAEAKDRTADAALAAADHDRRLQALHHAPDGLEPEGAA